MLATPKAIASPLLSAQSTPAIETPIRFALSLKKHEPYLPIASSMQRPLKDLAGTIKRVVVIEKPIVILVALNVKALFRPLRSTKLRPRLKQP